MILKRKEIKQMKKDVKKNPDLYRGNVKLLSGQITGGSFDGDKAIRRLKRKLNSYM